MKAANIERHFSAGECIVERGSARREIYVIRSGEVRLEGTAGQKALLLGPGDLFGEVPAILGEPHGYRAEADSDVALLAIDVPLLNRLCAESREFGFRLIRHLAERVAQPDQGSETVPSPVLDASLERLVRAILARSGEGDGPSPVSGKLRDLAADAELAVEVAYRHVQGLLDQRMLRLADDELTLIQPDRLRALIS